MLKIVSTAAVSYAQILIVIVSRINNNRNSSPCTVWTSRQRSCIERVGGLLGFSYRNTLDVWEKSQRQPFGSTDKVSNVIVISNTLFNW